ncbi:MAG TPA: Tex-like N-terminal domain-containing protein, partial [Planctomycetota bacterium]|nr:Tex-like N-terminal domain-containing protein [Planctomycetota bacterium]
MTAQLTLKTLAKEFSIKEEEVQAVLEMMDAGLLAPFIARVRRARTGALTENQLRRLCQRREELDELDRRRGTILRQLEKVEGIAPSVLAHIETCPDRFELEGLYVPNRRPEPEVQLAIDRGLTPLADLLIKPIPKADR